MPSFLISSETLSPPNSMNSFTSHHAGHSRHSDHYINVCVCLSCRLHCDIICRQRIAAWQRDAEKKWETWKRLIALNVGRGRIQHTCAGLVCACWSQGRLLAENQQKPRIFFWFCFCDPLLRTDFLRLCFFRDWSPQTIVQASSWHDEKMRASKRRKSVFPPHFLSVGRRHWRWHVSHGGGGGLWKAQMGWRWEFAFNYRAANIQEENGSVLPGYSYVCFLVSYLSGPLCCSHSVIHSIPKLWRSD